MGRHANPANAGEPQEGQCGDVGDAYVSEMATVWGQVYGEGTVGTFYIGVTPGKTYSLLITGANNITNWGGYIRLTYSASINNTQPTVVDYLE